jgi:hypothetical protein
MPPRNHRDLTAGWRIQIRYPWTILVCGGFLAFASCEKADRSTQLNATTTKTNMSDYDLAIQSGVQGHSYPGEFNQLFQNAVNGISYYGGVVGAPKWYSKAGLYRRYVLKMQLDIKLDSARTKIISTGPASLYLYEFTNITFRPDGAPKIEGRQLATLSSDDWRRLFEAHGDFQTLGITLETNKPVEHFETAWDRF